MQDVLFKETLMRVGHDEMSGVMRLIDEGHHGIAEKHTVGKLIAYIRKLENQLGIEIRVDAVPDRDKVIKINGYGGSYFAQKAA